MGFIADDNKAPRVLAIGAHGNIAVNAKCQRVHACTCSVPGWGLLEQIFLQASYPYVAGC